MWLYNSISSLFVVFVLWRAKLNKVIPYLCKPRYISQCQEWIQKLQLWKQLPSQQRTGPTRFQVITSIVSLPRMRYSYGEYRVNRSKVLVPKGSLWGLFEEVESAHPVHNVTAPLIRPTHPPPLLSGRSIETQSWLIDWGMGDQ